MWYRNLTEETLKLSQHYFVCLTELCKRKNIQLVVVIMPISPDVSVVIPKYAMQTFRKYLKIGAEGGNFKLVDLWKDPRFLDDDFVDGVHFNYAGSKKFDDIVVDQLQTKFPEVLKQMAAESGGKP
jgi:hypothetical protein